MSLDDLSYVTKEQQTEAIAFENRRRSREKRPGQQPPSRYGQSRAHAESDDEIGCYSDGYNSGPAPQQQRSSDWRIRNEATQSKWQERLQHNRQQAQQYSAFTAANFQQQQLENAVRDSTGVIAAALVSHSCCLVCLDQQETMQLCDALADKLFKAAQKPNTQQDQFPGQQEQQEQPQQQQDQQPGPQSQPQQQQQQQRRQHQQQQEQQEQQSQPLGTQPQQQRQHQHQHQHQQRLQVVQILGMRLVACHVMGASFWLPVPKVRCSCCQDEWEPTPAAAGFFGSAPLLPHVWFSRQLLDMYTALFVASGVSATAFAEALSRTAITADWLPDLPRSAKQLSPIDDRNLSAAWEQWRSVCAPWYSSAAVAADLGKGVLGLAACCPACAAVPPGDSVADTPASVPEHTARACLGDNQPAVEAAEKAGLLTGVVDMPVIGKTGKPFLYAACADAMVKGNRYSLAGKSSGEATSSADGGHMFFGPAHEQLWQMSAAGALPMSMAFGDTGSDSDSDTMQASPAADADDSALELDAHVQHQCAVQLSCARETSLNNSISDECGLVGLVCSHGGPLLSCMMAMPAPEKFGYYDLLLTYLQEFVDLQVLYLDTGCTYAAHWRLHMSPAHDPPKHVKTPWWHGRGHGPGCFVLNSAFFLPGSGRRIGENCEHLWALIRAVTKLARFMGKRRYLAALETALQLISENKLQAMAQTMVDMDAACRKKLEETQSRINQLLAAASDKGIAGDALMTAAVQTMASVAEQEDMPKEEQMLMEYVRCSEELRALQALRDNRRSLAVALPGAESRSLQSRAQDVKLLDKLIRRVARLQVTLGYDDPLAVDHPEYIKGLANLRDQQVRKLLKDIQRDVSILGNVLQERTQSGASSSLTRSQQRRAKTRRKRIRQLVDSVAAWQQYDLPSSPITAQLPSEWTEQVMNNLFKGTFPWRQLLDGDVPALLAEQFRDACAEEARTLEELQMQAIERSRVVAYFGYMQQQAQAQAEVKATARQAVDDAIMDQVAGVQDVATVASQIKQQVEQAAQLCAEEQIMLQWASTFECLQKDAVERFKTLA